MADRWHLFDSVLPKRFGKHFYELPHTALRDIYLVNSEGKIENYFKKVYAFVKI